MPLDLFGAVWRFDTNYSTNVFQNDKAKGHVLPEESGIFVQDNSVWLFWIWGNHWEYYSRVPNVRIENPLERRLVTDLAIIHRTNSIFDWKNLRKLKLWEIAKESFFDGLDLVVQELYLMSSFLC